MIRRLSVTVLLLVAVLGGWLWGASGRWELDRALRAATVRSNLLEARYDLLEARASMLGVRVSFCDADFDGMSRHLTDARLFVGRAGAWLDAPGVPAGAPALDLAVFGAHIDEAQRLVARFTPAVGAPASR